MLVFRVTRNMDLRLVLNTFDKKLTNDFCSVKNRDSTYSTFTFNDYKLITKLSWSDSFDGDAILPEVYFNKAFSE